MYTVRMTLWIELLAMKGSTYLRVQRVKSCFRLGLTFLRPDSSPAKKSIRLFFFFFSMLDVPSTVEAWSRLNAFPRVAPPLKRFSVAAVDVDVVVVMNESTPTSVIVKTADALSAMPRSLACFLSSRITHLWPLLGQKTTVFLPPNLSQAQHYIIIKTIRLTFSYDTATKK